MEKKIDVKKIVCLSICVVLIIIACIVGVDYNSIALKSGNGNNAKVSSLDSMADMLNSFNSQLSGFDYRTTDAYNANSTGSSSTTKYKSVTVHEETSGYVNVLSGQYYSKMTVQRSMDIGITDNATYYRSIFTVSADSIVKEYDKDIEDYKDVSHSSDSDIDMEIYMSDKRFLLRFNKFSVASDGKNLMGIERVLGQWADFTDDTDIGRQVISSLGSTNTKNFRIFGLMGDYMDRSDESIFAKSGSVYTLKKDPSKSFASSLFSIIGSGRLAEDFDCSFEVDLDKATSPLVTLLLDSDYSDTVEVASSNGHGTTKTQVSARVYEKDVFEFTNINNTVIDIPSSLSTISAEEFNEYMNELTEDD